MNCDQAFEVMTSSQRDCQRELSLHLSTCPRCREMRETLAPALHLFNEEPASFLKQDEGWPPSTEAVEIATCAARHLSQLAPRQVQRGVGLWGYTLTVVLGAGLVWGSIVRTPVSSSIPSIQRRETVCHFMRESRPFGIKAAEMTKTCLACHSVTSPAVLAR